MKVADTETITDADLRAVVRAITNAGLRSYPFSAFEIEGRTMTPRDIRRYIKKTYGEHAAARLKITSH